MINDQLKDLGQKAFALVTGVKPEEVVFKEDVRGEMIHSCLFKSDEKIIEGYFNHWAKHDSDDGLVCITKTQAMRNGFIEKQEFPFKKYRVSGINTGSPFVIN